VQFNFDDIDDNSTIGRVSYDHSTANIDYVGIPRSTSSIPITIPGGGVRQPSQRHTNFTPPRSYMVANPLAAKMVRSASAGSLPTAVSVLIGEHIRPGSLSGSFCVNALIPCYLSNCLVDSLEIAVFIDLYLCVLFSMLQCITVLCHISQAWFTPHHGRHYSD